MMNKGKISICRPHGHGCDYIAIELEDKTSGVPFLSARVDYVSFATALTGLGGRPCKFELRGVENVGKVCEWKVERVYVLNSPLGEKAAQIATAIQIHEINGWLGRFEDALNPHREAERDEDGAWYAVHYTRYVDARDSEKGAME